MPRTRNHPTEIRSPESPAADDQPPPTALPAARPAARKEPKVGAAVSRQKMAATPAKPTTDVPAPAPEVATKKTRARGTPAAPSVTDAPPDEAKRGSEKEAIPLQAPAEPRRQSKQARLIAMLERREGATIAELAAATGWQYHSVRGVISGALKKQLGLEVSSEQVKERGRVYRIAMLATGKRC